MLGVDVQAGMHVALCEAQCLCVCCACGYTIQGSLPPLLFKFLWVDMYIRPQTLTSTAHCCWKELGLLRYRIYISNHSIYIYLVCNLNLVDWFIWQPPGRSSCTRSLLFTAAALAHMGLARSVASSSESLLKALELRCCWWTRSSEMAQHRFTPDRVYPNFTASMVNALAPLFLPRSFWGLRTLEPSLRTCFRGLHTGKKPVVKQARYRVNEAIQSSTLRVIFPDGRHSVLDRLAAIKAAREMRLDLVEYGPRADPPVCKITNHKQILYEQTKSAQAADSKVRQQVKAEAGKEVQFTSRIADNDLEVKLKKVKRFLEKHLT